MQAVSGQSVHFTARLSVQLHLGLLQRLSDGPFPHPQRLRRSGPPGEASLHTWPWTMPTSLNLPCPPWKLQVQLRISLVLQGTPANAIVSLFLPPWPHQTSSKLCCVYFWEKRE